PEFLHDGEELSPGGEALVREDGGGVDNPERVRPDGEHGGADESVTGGGDVPDGDGAGGCDQVDGRRPRGVDHAAERSLQQQGEGGDQFVGPASILPVGAGAGGGAQLVAAVLDELQHVGHGRVTVEAFGENVDGSAEDDFLGVGDGAPAD